MDVPSKPTCLDSVVSSSAVVTVMRTVVLLDGVGATVCIGVVIARAGVAIDGVGDTVARGAA